MEKRTLIAVALSMFVLLGYQYFFAPKPPAAPVATQAALGQAATPPAGGSAPPDGQPATTPAGAVQPQQATALNRPLVPKEKISVRTPEFIADISNFGGSIDSFKLARYPVKAGDKTPVDLISNSVDQNFATSIAVAGAEELHEPAFAFSDIERTFDIKKGETRRIEMTRKVGEGLTFVKTFVITGGSYLMQVEYKLITSGLTSVNAEVRTAIRHTIVGTEGTDDRAFYAGGYFLAKEKIERYDLKKLEEEKGHPGIDVIGFENKYFTTALLSARSELTTKMKKSNGRFEAMATAPLTSVGSLTLTAYLGPKEYRTLKSIGSGMENVIDLGWFGIIGKPLLWLLVFINYYIGNYGITIILMTILVKAILYYPTLTSMKSMNNMKKIKPELDKIKEKYKDDSVRMNKEIWALYKTKNANPMSGCLPMFFQLPIFVALYNVLYNAIELRGAPFFGWIIDLSIKDPYYITPVIMGGTMYIQQKMTPSTMDPAQAKIFQFLPVIFTVMFLNFPAGLVVYWLTNNVLTIAQQYYLNHKMGEPCKKCGKHISASQTKCKHCGTEV